MFFEEEFLRGLLDYKGRKIKDKRSGDVLTIKTFGINYDLGNFYFETSDAEDNTVMVYPVMFRRYSLLPLEEDQNKTNDKEDETQNNRC